MVPMRGEFDQVITPDLRQEYAHAMLCNGNGACFNHDSTNVMCPSYKATKNRIHSPKGRASLVKEWLRARANNITPSEIEAAEAVFAAMSGCLGCKACTGKCPTKVSIPDLKSKFLNTYHATYRKRSMREYALGHIEHILQLASHVPRLWNTLIKYHLTPRFGMVDIPTFANNMSLRKKLRLQNIPLYKNLAQLASVKNPVIIVADVFSGLLDQKVLFASLNTLRYLGYSPYVIYPRVSGKALLVGGFLDKFKLHADQWGTLLNPLFTHKIPVVGIENSVTLIFRHEFATFASALNGTVLTLAELLAMNAQRLQMLVKNASKNMAPSTPMRKNIPKKQYALLSHCTEQATHPLDAAHWQKVFASIDQKLEAVAIGCCGMAGTYGHQHEHQVNSRKLFSMNWQPQLEQTQCQNLATGYSCRAQSKRFIDERTPHPIEALWEILQVQTASV